MEKYSEEVFTTSLFEEKVAVVCGPAGNKFMLYTANDCLASWVPSAALKLFNWLDSPGLSVKEVISKGRNFLYSEILKPESLRQYISIMDSLAREHMKTYWDASQMVKVYPLTQKYTLSLACKLLLGAKDAHEVERISEFFHLTLQALFSLPINLPGTKYNRALKGLENLKQHFLNIIAEKKNTLLETRESTNSNVLSRMLLDKNVGSISGWVKLDGGKKEELPLFA
ncbi:unnamed protein product [Coffea canephora]|uniref:Uncharacterized protein n=1 Tax=Coffea canephora TaxID=49390 RepID=A0A068V3W5_COFCA|nr:unnamed protein product [Coffea canephora]